MKSWIKQESPFLWSAAGLLLVSLVYILINVDKTHYHGLYYELPSLIRYAPWGLAIIWISCYLKKMSARFSLVFEAIAKFYWIFILSALGCYAIQFTPFHLIDAPLNHIDNLFGFNSGAVFNYTQHHGWLKTISNIAYKNLGKELFLLPFVLAFLSERRSVRVFFLANLIATFVTYNIYYFWPTTEPASVIPSVNFLQSQYDVVAQWYEIHNHIANYMHIGALIGFPSFHVIWATLLTYLCRNRKWLFYPVMVFNTIVVISTMTLGWHFLTDVVAGLIVAFGCIYVAEKWLSKEKASVSVSVNNVRLVSARQFRQRFNSQALNDNRKNHDAVSHG